MCNVRLACRVDEVREAVSSPAPAFEIELLSGVSCAGNFAASTHFHRLFYQNEYNRAHETIYDNFYRLVMPMRGANQYKVIL